MSSTNYVINAISKIAVTQDDDRWDERPEDYGDVDLTVAVDHFVKRVSECAHNMGVRNDAIRQTLQPAAYGFYTAYSANDVPLPTPCQLGKWIRGTEEDGEGAIFECLHGPDCNHCRYRKDTISKQYYVLARQMLEIFRSQLPKPSKLKKTT